MAPDLASEFPNLLKEIKLKEKYGFNRAYVAGGDVKWSRVGVEFLAKLYQKWGWEVVGKKLFPGGTMDFSLMLHDVKKKKADMMFVMTDFDEFKILVKQWRDLKIPVALFTMGGHA